MRLYATCPCGRVHDTPGVCDEWKAKKERECGTRTKRGLDNRWLRLRDLAIRERPYCEYCGATEDLTGDHRVPRSKGGVARTTADVIVACRSCNSSRGNRAPSGPVAAPQREPEQGFPWIA